MKQFKKYAFTFLIFGLSMLLIIQSTAAAPYSRIKDIADFEGVRTNALIGYGLVVGLNGTGDSAKSIPFTRQTLITMLERLGVNSKSVEQQLKMKNVAAVMVTAEMPSYARQGSRINVTVSSLGDAKSITAGQLIATAMIGADGQTYAVSRGSINTGGVISKEGSKNYPTTGVIINGATIEKETGHELTKQKRIRIMLRNPDFTTATRIKEAINKAFDAPISKTVDNGTVDVEIPENLRSEMVSIIKKIEHLRVSPDNGAKVVIDEQTGTIVMGTNVQISEVAISHANLTVRVTELQQIVQPDGFSDGAARVIEPGQNKEQGVQFQVLESGLDLVDLIDGLNALGVKPKDIISILQSIKVAGALQAEIVLM